MRNPDPRASCVSGDKYGSKMLKLPLVTKSVRLSCATFLHLAPCRVLTLAFNKFEKRLECWNSWKDSRLSKDFHWFVDLRLVCRIFMSPKESLIALKMSSPTGEPGWGKTWKPEVLCLGAGGIKGLDELGAIWWFWLNGNLSNVHTYIGSSIGGIIGALMAMDGRLPTFWNMRSTLLSSTISAKCNSLRWYMSLSHV